MHDAITWSTSRLLIVAGVLASALVPGRAEVVPRPATSRASEVCDIVEYGTFVAVGERIQHPDPGAVTGEWSELDAIEFLQHTQIIPKQRETSFGIRYRLRGLPTTRAVAVTWRITFPTAIQEHQGWERTFAESAPSGELENFVGYELSLPDELVAGRWRVEVLVDRRPHCTVDFDVR